MLLATTGCDEHYGRSYRRTAYYGHSPRYYSESPRYYRSSRSYYRPRSYRSGYYAPYSHRYHGDYYHRSHRRGPSVTIYR